MVILHHPRERRRPKCSGWQPIHALVVLAGLAAIYIGATMIFLIVFNTTDTNTGSSVLLSVATSPVAEDHSLPARRISRPTRPQTVFFILDESMWTKKRNDHVKCAYKSLADLQSAEAYPQAGSRHMVNPPSGGKLSLVCCETTVGNLNIVAHHKWAPLGAQRFLDMVTSGYFNSTVPFMRCIQGFLCQFGLNSDPSKSREFDSNLPDDPNWLPEGPLHRENEQHVMRFAKGYLAYAGSGRESRGNQFIMALEDNGPLAGGSPWEVPWGELVSAESFETLGKIYTGYGEEGPSQGQLGRLGMTPSMKEQFPLLDYIQSCVLVDEAPSEDMSSESASSD